KVSCRDRANEVESQPVGPAEARDDSPPPPVENLVAADTQADNGGSISISWAHYSAPPDFKGFRVYRAQTAFSRVSSAQLIADIPDDPNLTFYRDATTEDGVQYWYAVTAYDDENNEVQQVQAVGPVTSSPNMMLSFPAGLSMIAIGARTQVKDMAALLNIRPSELRLARWDPVQQQYRLYEQNPTDSLLQQEPGRGFWLMLTEPLLLNISGQPVQDASFSIPLTTGWNQLGNPFDHDLRWQGVTVAARGTQYTLSQSNNAGLTGDFAWIWDPYLRSYQLVTEYEGFGLKTIKQNQGFWFLAYQPCELVLPGQAQSAAVRERRKVDIAWKLRLVARCGDVEDHDNYIGVSSQAAVLNQIVTPPLPGPGVDVYFVNRGVAGRAAASFVTAGQSLRWDVRVACAGVSGKEVELRWPDLSELPSSVRPILIDCATGRLVYMRTASRYVFQPAEAETERQFQIVDECVGRQLQVQALAARQSAQGAEVCFTLSAPATVTVDVMNIAGRLVRRIVADRETAAGPCAVRWNGCSAGGSPVPPGRYLVRVIARAEDGQQVTATTSIVLAR
ncbi:MAG: hypothetical protein H5T86_08680, partial [Armatimonadetes bacterium]|nr:hypothetical protein [Armatimonadota bacterium]